MFKTMKTGYLYNYTMQGGKVNGSSDLFRQSYKTRLFSEGNGY